MDQVTTAPEQRGGEVLAAISNEMVRLMREALGKGPTRCKTHWAGEDILLVVLGEGGLAAERTLWQAGRGDAVRRNRDALQDVLEQRMRAVVEGHTGRRVAAFMSCYHQEPDIQVELFVLGPAAESGGLSEK